MIGVVALVAVAAAVDGIRGGERKPEPRSPGADAIDVASTAESVSGTLVYLDRHSDLNVPSSTIDGALDWMGVAHMLGLPGTLPALGSPPLLAAADVLLLAADADQMRQAEQRAIAEHGIRAIPMADVAADPAIAAERALALLGHEHVLVHFDVDVVDFVDLPLSENTGLNIGLPFATATAALDVLTADPRVATLTVTEHNPLHGAADGSTTAALAAALKRG